MGFCCIGRTCVTHSDHYRAGEMRVDILKRIMKTLALVQKFIQKHIFYV